MLGLRLVPALRQQNNNRRRKVQVMSKLKVGYREARGSAWRASRNDVKAVTRKGMFPNVRQMPKSDVSRVSDFRERSNVGRYRPLRHLTRLSQSGR